jgi:hypothetical protein
MSEPEIQIVVIHDLTEEVLAEMLLPAEGLPDDFEQGEFTLNIDGVVYEVVRAKPATVAKYRSTGRLLLRVNRVSNVTADEVLYTIPTLCATIPDSDAGLEPGDDDSLFVIHEDEWRQIELVSAAQDAIVEEELAAVIEIFEAARVAVEGENFDAFRSVHIREQPVRPLPAGLTIGALRGAFEPAKFYDHVVYEGHDELVPAAYALDLGSLALYGHAADGELRSAALLVVDAPPRLPPETIARLAAFMASHDLLLVDWCRVQAVPAVAADLARYLAHLA